MKRKIILIASIGFLVNCLAFEVNTHQAITRCAISTDCNQNGAVNLHKFAENALLEKQDYSTQMFENYGDNYKDYAKIGEGFTKWKITIPDGNKGDR